MDISRILETKYQGTVWALNGDTYDGLQWLDESSKPTQAELEALWPQVQYEEELAEVERLRNAAYSDPNTGSDVMLIKATLGEDGLTIDDVKARKAEIRAMYPKPEAP